MVATGYNETNLYNELFNKYNAKIRPVLNYSEPVVVTIGLSLRKILHVDEIRQSFKITANIHLFWKDRRLTWNETEYPGISNIVIPYDKSVWIPDIMIYNALEKPSELGVKDSFVRVFINGQIFIWTQTNIDSACSIKTKRFPFDEQLCRVVFINVISSNDMVMIQPLQNEVSLSEYVEIAEWEFMESNVQTVIYPYNISTDITKTERKVETFHFTALIYNIRMRRSCKLCFYNIIMPVFILAILNMLSFFVPCESGEKTSYPIAMFLTLAVFLTVITGSLPESIDGVSYLSLYVTFQLVISAITLLCSVISLQIHYRMEIEHVPNVVVTSLQFLTCRQRQKQEINKENSNGQEHRVEENVETKDVNNSKISHTFDRFVFFLLLCCQVISTALFTKYILDGDDDDDINEVINTLSGI